MRIFTFLFLLLTLGVYSSSTAYAQAKSGKGKAEKGLTTHKEATLGRNEIRQSDGEEQAQAKAADQPASPAVEKALKSNGTPYVPPSTKPVKTEEEQPKPDPKKK